MRNDSIYAWRRAAIPLVVTMVMIQGGCLSGPAPADRFYRLEIPEAAAYVASREMDRQPSVTDGHCTCCTARRCVVCH